VSTCLSCHENSAARGQVDQIIQKALEDGVIEPHEAEEINEYHRRHLAAREEEIRAIVALFSRKKSQKVTPASVQLRASWRVVFSGETNA
jgi:hypothetical protein